jgi:hypothetical protein
MIESSMERRALPREVINRPALLSFAGIYGRHPCVVRDINVFGACLSTPYYMFANNCDLSFSDCRETFLPAEWCGGGPQCPASSSCCAGTCRNGRV